MKKAVSGIMLILLILTSMLTLALNIHPVRAWTGTICIRADGSIEPSDAPIITYDKITYTLTADIISERADGIIIQRDNVILDGAGHKFQGIGYGWTGIELRGSHATIQNVKIAEFNFGIAIYWSDSNTISKNVITNNDNGIYLCCSNSNTLTNNIITNNFIGISMGGSSNNILLSNVVSSSSGYGIYLGDSDYNVLSSNTITNNAIAIGLCPLSNNNIVLENVITNNNYGILLFGTEMSSCNTFYHNNFVNNGQQVHIDARTNVWDDGYPSGGNYWSDYAGIDQFSGPNQDQPGSDGIGDTPYIIDEYNRDRYPLMKPYAPPSVLLPPVASFSYNPSNPKVNEKVSFDASASYDPDGQIVSYKWSFGDGSIDEGKTVTHAYSKEGSYKVTLMVIDNDGKSCSTSKTVTVVKPTPTANRLKILDKYFDILNKSTGWTQSGSFYYLNYEPDGKRLPRSSKTVSGYTTVDDGDIYPSQCVDFVRALSNTIYIKTKDWRQGPNVMTATDIEPGTVVATFKGGKYPADGTGHVAVFAGFTYSDGRKTGFKVFDQNWRTDGGLGVVGKHFIYTIGSGVADADNYYIVTLEGISIKATCPVDLEVIDPDSLEVSKEFSEIPEAIYIEEDLNDDGYPDDYIFIPERKIGEYLISVIPEPDADPNTNYTLEVSSADMTLILAENVPLHDIPTEPYIIASATFETPPPPSVITATIDVDPDNLNLGSKGKWVTAYIELPEGYNIADINVSSILLNGGIPVDVNAPIAIGDYDNDSIPDLFVKFNRDEVTTYILNCIDTAELYINRFMIATLKITGKLNDETRFQGNYTIRIIMRMQKSSKLVQFL